MSHYSAFFGTGFLFSAQDQLGSLWTLEKLTQLHPTTLSLFVINKSICYRAYCTAILKL